jgi:hypothetical protein
MRQQQCARADARGGGGGLAAGMAAANHYNVEMLSHRLRTLLHAGKVAL